MGQPVLTNPSYYDIEKGCAVIVTKILQQEIPVDVVVGLARGGLLPAVIISHLLNKPMTPICYSAVGGKGDNKNHHNLLPPIFIDNNMVSGEGTLPQLPNLLFVDDIIDSGETMSEVFNHYVSQEYPSVITATLYYKAIDNPLHVPDLYWQKIPKDSDWIIFPFEV